MSKLRPVLLALGVLSLTGCRFAIDDSLPFAQPLDSSTTEESTVDYDGLSHLLVAPQQAILIKALPMSLSTEQLTLTRIKTKVKLAVQGYTGRTSDLQWKSSNPEIAVVDGYGEVTSSDGSGIGEAVISVASKSDPTQRATALIQVVYLDTAIKLSYPTSTIRLSETRKLQLASLVTYSDPTQRGRVIGTDDSGKAVTWSSSDDTLAQVNALGEVNVLTDAATGSVTITARSTYDPAKRAEVTLKIVD